MFRAETQRRRDFAKTGARSAIKFSRTNISFDGRYRGSSILCASASLREKEIGTAK